MDRIIISVGGMTCSGCVKSVERALGNQPGVVASKAALESKNVSVEFDSAMVTAAQLEQAIRKAGFSVPA
jgi:copper chaperone